MFFMGLIFASVFLECDFLDTYPFYVILFSLKCKLVSVLFIVIFYFFILYFTCSMVLDSTISTPSGDVVSRRR